jgi:hypothetical protein
MVLCGGRSVCASGSPENFAGSFKELQKKTKSQEIGVDQSTGPFHRYSSPAAIIGCGIRLLCYSVKVGFTVSFPADLPSIAVTD